MHSRQRKSSFSAQFNRHIYPSLVCSPLAPYPSCVPSLALHHRLSERNCIEIVTKLIDLGLLDVVHTNTGKEYITPEQITREIRDELIVSGGGHHRRVCMPFVWRQIFLRFCFCYVIAYVVIPHVIAGRIGLPELSQTLNVDFSHIEARAQKLVNEEKNIFLVNGYLVNNIYIGQ